MPPEPNELVDIVERELTPLARKRLLAYTRSLLRKKSFYGTPWRQGVMLPEGGSEQDYINQAIEKILGGDRQWNRDAYPEFMEFFKGVISSDLNHLAVSEENLSTKRFDPTDPVQMDRIGSASHIENPEDIYLSKWTDGLKKQFVAALLDEMYQEPDLQQVAACLIDGKTPRVIAGEMGLNANQVQALKKRLYRRATAILQRPEFKSLVDLVTKGQP